MKVLVGCEESQAVCIEFRKRGHEAFSCDLQPCSGGHPEWHIQADVLDVIGDGWDLGIFFPPCPYLTVTGNRWFLPEFSHLHFDRFKYRVEAIKFFSDLWYAPIEKISLENPVGIMSTVFRKPDQIIQPYYFGDPEPKKTCLWLKNLPKLIWRENDDMFGEKTVVEPNYLIYKSSTKKSGFSRYPSLWKKGKGHGKERSVTFPGIARAMAEQWG